MNVIPTAKSAGTRLAWRSLLAILVFGGFIAPALALESASYRLYDTLSNYGTTGAPDSSTNYLLNENGVTWYALPVESAHYSVVTVPPSAASSISSAASLIASSASPTSVHPSGGRRPTRSPYPLHPAAGRRSSRSSASSASAAVRPSATVFSSSSAGLYSAAPNDSPFDDERGGTLSSEGGFFCAGRACQCDRAWSFGGMCVVSPARSLFPVLGILCAIAEALLFFLICRRRHDPQSRKIAHRSRSREKKSVYRTSR